jgi:hypothetical protein
MSEQNHFPRPTAPETEPQAAASGEALVTDARDGLTPSQMVERRLESLLSYTPLPAQRLSTAPVRSAFRPEP